MDKYYRKKLQTLDSIKKNVRVDTLEDIIGSLRSGNKVRHHNAMPLLENKLFNITITSVSGLPPETARLLYIDSCIGRNDFFPVSQPAGARVISICLPLSHFPYPSDDRRQPIRPCRRQIRLQANLFDKVEVKV